MEVTVLRERTKTEKQNRNTVDSQKQTVSCNLFGSLGICGLMEHVRFITNLCQKKDKENQLSKDLNLEISYMQMSLFISNSGIFCGR
jgi:hypothetical protein